MLIPRLVPTVVSCQFLLLLLVPVSCVLDFRCSDHTKYISFGLVRKYPRSLLRVFSDLVYLASVVSLNLLSFARKQSPVNYGSLVSSLCVKGAVGCV